MLGAVVGAGFDGLAAGLLGGPGNGTPAPPLPFKDPPTSVLLAGGVLGTVLLAGGVLGTVLLAGGVLGTVLLPVRDPPPTLVPPPATGCGRCP